MLVSSNIVNKLLNDGVHNDLDVLVKDLEATISGQLSHVISQGPTKLIEEVIKDTSHAIFGQNGPHVVSDAVNIVQGIATITADNILNVFNGIPSSTTAPQFDQLPGNINAQPDKIITETHYHSGASLGDMSWLIYKAKTDTNTNITDKWKLVSHLDIETSHGFNSRTYVDGANKEVVITLEGTQPNSKLSPLWLSKDGLADLEIGLGIIPPQMREGYKEFKKIVDDVERNYVSKGYGISVAGHSLGGGLAQMMSGMYFIDTGKALPTMAQAGPGMLRQLKLYAEEQLLAGESIHLPTGGTVKLHFGTALQRADEAKMIVGTFKAQDFSNIVNLITELDPVGAVNYNIDPDKDGHVGVNMKVPYLLTAREDLQDLEYTAFKPINSANIITPSNLPKDPLGLFPNIGDIHVTRFDRHEPDQSDALWSGTAVGLKKLDGAIGLGSAVFRDYDAPKKVWDGSQLTLSEEKRFGTDGDDIIKTGDKDTFVLSGNGNDTIAGGKGGDMLSGGAGNDTIYGGVGDDYLAGDAGNDTIYGDEGNDILFGGAGNDYLDGGVGSDVLCGGSGDDTLIWSAGNDILMGNEGNDTFIINNSVKGNAQIKWERNFTNFGNDIVNFDGALDKDSSVVLNFADEIRFADMKWSQNGNNIIMTDDLGDKTASVTFKNAFDSFGRTNDQIDFQFTNGRLYLDDETYHVRAGAGTVTAIDDPKYKFKGNILVGSAGNDTLVSGTGNDLLFGGAGADSFVFNGSFGKDTIIGSESQDKVCFNTIFDDFAFNIKHNGNDLVIEYQKNSIANSGTLTITNWYVTGDKLNTFAFSDASYKIEDNHFIKII
jgi:Ca2+-binding RTX toxin-like protein